MMPQSSWNKSRSWFVRKNAEGSGDSYVHEPRADRILARAKALQQKLLEARTDLDEIRMRSRALSDFSEILPQAHAQWAALLSSHETRLSERALEMQTVTTNLERDLETCRAIIGNKTDMEKPFYWKIGEERGSFSRTLFDTHPNSWISRVYNSEDGYVNDEDHREEIGCNPKVWQQIIQFMRNGQIPTAEQAEFGLLGQAKLWGFDPLARALGGDESRFYWKIDGEQGSFPRALFDKFPQSALSARFNATGPDRVANDKSQPALIDCDPKVWRQIIEFMRSHVIPDLKKAGDGLVAEAKSLGLNTLAAGLVAQNQGICPILSSSSEFRACFCLKPDERSGEDRVDFDWANKAWYLSLLDHAIYLGLQGDASESVKAKIVLNSLCVGFDSFGQLGPGTFRFKLGIYGLPSKAFARPTVMGNLFLSLPPP